MCRNTGIPQQLCSWPPTPFHRPPPHHHHHSPPPPLGTSGAPVWESKAPAAHPLPGSLPRPASPSRNADSQPRRRGSSTHFPSPARRDRGAQSGWVCREGGWRAVGRASGRRWELQARPGAPGSECWADPGNRRKGRGGKERKLKIKRTEKAKGENEEKKKNRSAWGQAVRNGLPTLFLGSLFSWPSPQLGPPGRMCPCPWGQPASRMSLCFELT